MWAGIGTNESTSTFSRLRVSEGEWSVAVQAVAVWDWTGWVTTRIGIVP
jgi:hypothetical protein